MTLLLSHVEAAEFRFLAGLRLRTGNSVVPGARHFSSLWFFYSQLRVGSIKTDLIRDFLGRSPHLDDRDVKEEEACSTWLDGRINSAFERASTPLFFFFSFFLSSFRVIRPVTCAGAGKAACRPCP